jgi:hypothetical protein
MSKSIVKLLEKKRILNLITNNEIKKNEIVEQNKIYIDNISTDIPKNLYLCYKTKNIPEYIIPNWKKLNPDYNVFLYDNDDCINFLNENYGQLYVDIFNYLKDGPIKADFFRICILYKLGGVYCDIDIEPLLSFNDFVEKNISFLTCLSANNKFLNPHIIMCAKDNILLKWCIDVYIDYYKNNKVYAYWDWSIVHIMKDCMKKIFPNIFINDCVSYDKNNNKYQFIKEVGDFSCMKSFYCKYKGKRVLNNRYQNYNSELHTF